MTHYWLLKSEPTTWSFDMQEDRRTTSWDGVRNHQACGYMKRMELEDLCLFYHSNIGKEIVGIVKVIKTYHPDLSDDTGRFGMVDVAFYKRFAKPVTLETIKKTPALGGLYLVKQPRLSVMPVTEDEWNLILDAGL